MKCSSANCQKGKSCIQLLWSRKFHEQNHYFNTRNKGVLRRYEVTCVSSDAENDILMIYLLFTIYFVQQLKIPRKITGSA